MALRLRVLKNELLDVMAEEEVGVMARWQPPEEACAVWGLACLVAWCFAGG